MNRSNKLKKNYNSKHKKLERKIQHALFIMGHLGRGTAIGFGTEFCDNKESENITAPGFEEESGGYGVAVGRGLEGGSGSG